MRLSNQAEGLISNYHRLIDGYLAGDRQREAAGGRAASLGRIDVPCRDLGF